jgi:Holliday junction resolvase
MSFRRAAKTDDNQAEVVALFRKLGWYVLIVSQLKNCCDIIVSKNGRTVAIEIKDGKKPPSARKLSEGEQKFRAEWQGEYALVETADDVIGVNNATKSK